VCAENIRFIIVKITLDFTSAPRIIYPDSMVMQQLLEHLCRCLGKLIKDNRGGTNMGSAREVELGAPWLSTLKPFIVICDSRGPRVVMGRGNYAKATVDNDAVVLKGYLNGGKPYLVDVDLVGNGIKYLTIALNSILSTFIKASNGNETTVALYHLEFKLPRSNDVELSVRLHRQIRRCFWRLGHSWVGYGICFDVNEWNSALGPQGYLRVYRVMMSRREALELVNLVMNSISSRIRRLEEEVKYELRGYRRRRLIRRIRELEGIMSGWAGFGRSL
jgi:hypothetical protein